MDMERLRPLLMMAVRYAISGIGVWLAAKGFPTGYFDALNNEITPLIVGAILFYGPQLWAAYVRPSAKAMAAAVKIDKLLPEDAPVIIQTPGNTPNIVIPPASRG